MSSFDQTAARAAYTSQALATMGVDPAWDAALSNYLRLEALQHADHEFGALSVARELSDHCHAGLTDTFGEGWRKNAEAVAEWQPVMDEMSAAEDLYCETYSEPFWEASRVLMKTPAPTLAAALFKCA